jgi:peptidoglycan/LPS O-acetylase OafA/YrhL
VATISERHGSSLVPAGYLPGLDGLRGIAVVVVVVLHTWDTALPGGFIGVDLFFVLSGFLITRLLLSDHGRNSVSLPAFYARRTLRLLPALVLTMIVVGSVALAYGDTLTLAGLRWNYFANFIRAEGGSLGRLGHLWSLAIEEQFYLVWPPLLMLVLRRGGRRWALGMALCLAFASATTRYLLLNNGASIARVYNGLDTRAEALLIGCVVALLPSLRPPPSWLRWLALMTMVLALLLGSPLDSVMVTYGLTGVALASAVLVLAAAGPWAKPFSWGPLIQIGRVSYGIYLFHYPLANWLPGRGFAEFVIVGLASWALATLSFELVESRILQWSKQRSRVLYAPIS